MYNWVTCGYICAAVNMNLRTLTKVKSNGKSMEMYADKQSRTISCCTAHFLALYKFALFHSYLCGIKGFMWMKEQLFIAFSINLKTILRSNVDFERQSPCPLAFCGYFSWPMNNEKYIICVMIPEFGWLSDQGQGKKFIKLSFSHKHPVNCQTLHDDTTDSVYLFKIPFHIFCDLEHISRLQQRQTVWGENYCISYKWCLHCSFDFLSVLHWLQRAPPAIHHVAHFSFEDICKDAGGKIQLPWYITENCDNY